VYGGANSLVMSLWSVNDDASAFLMEKFYEHLAAGMEKDVALRQAKLDYLQAAQGQDLACHPALWAAFVQLGNIQPIHLQSPQAAGSFLWWVGLGLLGLLAGGFVWLRKPSKREA
jgi:CHAT domain